MKSKHWSEIILRNSKMIGTCGATTSEAAKSLRAVMVRLQGAKAPTVEMKNSIGIMGNPRPNINAIRDVCKKISKHDESIIPKVVFRTPRRNGRVSGFAKIFLRNMLVGPILRDLAEIENAKVRYHHITNNILSDSDISDLSKKANSLPGQSIRNFINLVNNKAYKDSPGFRNVNSFTPSVVLLDDPYKSINRFKIKRRVPKDKNYLHNPPGDKYKPYRSNKRI